MIKLSVVILSNTVTDLIFETTINCINSLKKFEKFSDEYSLEIILVESNKKYFNQYQFPKDVNIIIPEDEFGFHKFLNVGIKASNGDFISLCNNDLIFHQNWFSEILKISKERKDILSFSPIDPRVEINKYNDDYVMGFKVTQHIKGWCFVCKKEIFNKIGLLDEKFKFYYSDNDYALTLLYYNIKHAVVTKSHVSHLEKVVTNELNQDKDTFFLKDNSNILLPKYLRRADLKLILSERALYDHMIYYNKWGNSNSVYKFVKYVEILNNIHLNIISRILLIVKRTFKV